jgi:anthranilate/para-aminobenzoate synthase component II
MNVLIDFDDSFTFNLKQYLESLGVDVNVIHWTKLLGIDLSKIKLIILGPGPGHPHDYSDILYLLKKIIELKSIKIFGVCLGHQIICKILGFKIERLILPIHGQSKNIQLNSYFQRFLGSSNIDVQFYNSLFVSANSKSNLSSGSRFQIFMNMIIIYRNEWILSTQFHPESIGSTSLVEGVKDFLS